MRSSDDGVKQETTDAAGRERRLPLGGVVHTYLGYDPKNFPSPTEPPPDLASAAFEHMLEYGSMREFTDEELARAVRLEPSMFPRLGPSLESLAAMLRERKARILATFETDAAAKQAKRNVRETAGAIVPPGPFKDEFCRAVEQEQIRDLEALWYKQRSETSEFSRGLVHLIERMGEQYQVDELASKYAFTGTQPMSVDEALAVKEELEAIDRLLKQLEEAAKTAQIAIIDMDELSQMVDPEAMEGINRIQRQIEEYIREEAKRQGLEQAGKAYALSPRAYRLFQQKLLSEIFSELEAARSGRHRGPVIGEGPVELERTKPYEFGDPVAGMDVVQTVVNAVARGMAGAWVQGQRRSNKATERRRGEEGGDALARVRAGMEDVEIHRTRNSPKCATAVLIDMSGSMRYGGQYVNAKRMALALDGLIRTEYPGDFLAFFEMFTVARRRPTAEVPGLMPKMVSIGSPVVRLKADLGDPKVSESALPQHFTNIQHALRLARQTLAVQDTPNRQVMLITDGLPTAHFEDSVLYMLYPPDPRTEAATMREARLCAREGITINIFLLPSWSQSEEDVQFAQRMAEATRGRVFFTGGRDLDRFVLWDYVRQRRKIIA